MGTALAAEATERPALALGTETALAWDAQPTDTLRYQVRAGQTLIVSLPRQVDGREATYRLLEAPALSWLVDRSFMWRTTEGERGRLAIRVERLAGETVADTLVLLVDILD